jgi:hypothetical protein
MLYPPVGPSVGSPSYAGNSRTANSAWPKLIRIGRLILTPRVDCPRPGFRPLSEAEGAAVMRDAYWRRKRADCLADAPSRRGDHSLERRGDPAATILT